MAIVERTANIADGKATIVKADTVDGESGVLCKDMVPAPAICPVAGVVSGLTLVTTEVSHHAGNGR